MKRSASFGQMPGTLRHIFLGALLLLTGALEARAADTYDPVSGQLTIGSVQIGNATYSNMVVTLDTVDPLISGPAGAQPDAILDSYNPANQQLTVSSVAVGAASLNNIILPVTGLVSVGGVSGADSYDGATHQLSIGSLQFGNRYFDDIVIVPGAILSIGGGMPSGSRDQYDAGNNQLLIPAVAYNGHVYTNVLITVAQVLSLNESTPTLSGRVLSGVRPIANAVVSVWATGTATVQLGSSVATDSTGGFALSLQCPSDAALIYVTASGGSVGGGAANPATYLASALGVCGNIPPSIVINEITSVAAAYALNGFANLSAIVAGTNGAPVVFQGKSPGLNNAFAVFANLAEVTTGLVANSAAVGNQPDLAAKMHLLGNAMAACVNAPGTQTSGACAALFSCARQNAVYSPSTSLCAGGFTPLVSDVLSAAVEIGKNAGLVSLPGLGAVANLAPAPYAPALLATPADAILTLAYPIPNSPSIAIDAAGNLWTLQSSATPALQEVSPAGALLSGPNGYSGGGLSANTNAFAGAALAIDQVGNIWIGGMGEVAEFTRLGVPTSIAPDLAPDLASSLLGAASGAAVDPSGNIWFADGQCCTTADNEYDLVQVTSTGTVRSGASGYLLPSAGGALPAGIAVDAAGNTWTASGQNIVETNNGGFSIGEYGNQTFASGNTAYWSAVAIDPGGNVWALDYANSAAVILSAPNNYSLSGPYTGGGLNAATNPSALALDGFGHAWIANQGVTSVVTELNPNGTVLSPGAGFVSGGTIDGALGIAVDQAGNVWVADGNQTLYMLVGAGGPTVNPVVMAVNNGFTP